MKYIQSHQFNGWLICDSNMHLVHIGSDYRQLLWVLLGHPHPRKVALSSTRVLSMQGFALLNGSLAGRFIPQSIHPPPSISPLDQPISNCAGGLPAVGWTPIINRLVKRLVGRHFDGGFRNRFANLWAVVFAQNFWESFAAALVVTSLLGANVVPRSAHLGMFLTRTAAATSGEVSLLVQLGLPILPCYAQKPALDALFLFVWFWLIH